MSNKKEILAEALEKERPANRNFQHKIINIKQRREK
jgi:hypothetical protein